MKSKKIKVRTSARKKFKAMPINGHSLVKTKNPIHQSAKTSHNKKSLIDKRKLSCTMSDENSLINSTKVNEKCDYKPITITMDPKSTSSIPSILLYENNFEPRKFIRKTNGVKSPKSANEKQAVITVVELGTPHITDEESEIDEFESDDQSNESDDSENSIVNRSKNRLKLQNKSTSMLNCSDSSDKNNDSVSFYSLRNKVICIMKPRCKFSFYGKLKIQILYGAVEIYGATLDSSNTTTPLEIYSPRGTSFIEVQAAENKNIKNISNQKLYIWKILKENNININDSNSLVDSLNNIERNWAVFTLQYFDNILTNFLEKYYRHRLFPLIQDSSNYSWTDRRRAEIILQAYIYLEHEKRKTIDVNNFKNVVKHLLHNWDVNKNMKVLIAGGKNVGKSTSMRYLVNKLIEKCKKVIVIDLDPGQSEFTPPGCISFNIIDSYLLGPNFTHLQIPYYQIYIGAVDITRCLTNYIQAIKMLVDCLDKYLIDQQKQIPIVVNTMGFCKNIGWNIICHAIKFIKPTNVIQIKSSISKNNFDQLLSCNIINHEPNIWTISKVVDSLVEYELHGIDSEIEGRSRTGETWNIEPHQQRDIAMLAYLSQIIKLEKVSKIWNGERNISSSINAIIPYEVSFASVKISLGSQTTSSVLSVINGNIVALCGDNFSNVQEQESQSDCPEVLNRIPLITCYGFGIIRGVDMEKKKIYVNTPISISMLKYVNCLIGCMSIPSGLLNLKRSGVPYTRGECNLPTSQDPRRGYFRMRYNKDISLLPTE